MRKPRKRDALLLLIRKVLRVPLKILDWKNKRAYRKGNQSNHLTKSTR
jgi:hypothetical protein